MPPKVKPPTPRTKCIKFGEILIDENKKILLLCENCFQDYHSVPEFCKHLKDCERAKHIFQSTKSGSQLDCDTGNLLRNINQSSRELVIYGIKAKPTERRICDIEAEILNPRWYTDAAASSPIRTLNKNSAIYNNLIEEVTPFVQFKENVRSLSTPQQKAQDKKNILRNKPVAVIQNEPSTQTPPTTAVTVNSKKTTSNLKSTQPRPSSYKPEQGKPACARNLANTSTADTAKANLKRKLSNQANGTAKNQPAAKRIQIPPDLLPATKKLPAAADILPKNCLNKKIGIQIKSQTLKIRTPSVVSNQPVAATPKTVNNIIPAQKIQKNTQRQPLPKPASTAATTMVVAAAPAPPPANDKRTVDILNKLQTLGLKVQRTNPPPKPISVSKEKDTATLEIIKKLQSKGMEIKRLPKTSPTNAAGSFPTQASKTQSKISAETSNLKSMNSTAFKNSTTMVSVPTILIRNCN